MEIVRNLTRHQVIDELESGGDPQYYELAVDYALVMLREDVPRENVRMLLNDIDRMELPDDICATDPAFYFNYAVKKIRALVYDRTRPDDIEIWSDGKEPEAETIRRWLDRQIVAMYDTKLSLPCEHEEILNLAGVLKKEIQIHGVRVICEKCGYELIIEQPARADGYYEICFSYSGIRFFELIKKED